MVTKTLPEIKGFQETTLIDWDGKIASIIFLGGCNFRCGFCHSSSLVTHPEKLESVSFNDIASFLGSKRGWVDGVVITGGEPTLCKERLINLINEIKEFSLLVKLDTNGTCPDILKKLIGDKLVEYIALDIKAPLRADIYSKVAGIDIDIDKIIASKDLIINSGIDYEIRTTVVPTLIGADEVVDIAKSIHPAKKYCIQQFVPRDTIDPFFLSTKPYSVTELEKMAQAASKYLPKVHLRRN
ncbi:MAG: anaerobic ribonucleoside-triphosphate reductase activating protein [Candidatus Omnitrophica bacterium]|nr:anaerobic ribonucleoside-triphosphate reductase activating protein [Candidatus Omnitrophota bacterium]